MQFFLFLAFLVAVLFVVITFQNPANISVTFINWTFSQPLSAVLALPFAAGILTGLFLFIPLWWKKSKQIRMQKKRIDEMDRELKSRSDQGEPPEAVKKEEAKEEESKNQDTN